MSTDRWIDFVTEIKPVKHRNEHDEILDYLYQYDSREMLKRIFNLLRGESRASFARRIGVSPATVHDWFEKQATPSAESIAKISSVYKVSTDWIILGKEDAPDVKELKDRIAYNIREQSLLDRYRELPEQYRVMVDAYISGLAR